MKNTIKRAQKALVAGMLLALPLLPAMAQNEIDNVLKNIEANNKTLGALREQMEAQKLGNRTGIYLSNPEIEFNYLWGSPSPIGNRTDMKAVQSFDFPAAYVHRSKLSKLENANVDMLYKSERINLLLQAKQTCIQLVYYNALAKEYAVRLDHARLIAETFRKKFAKGDANILEDNKARLNLVAAENEKNRIEMERATLLSELQTLNGGAAVAFVTDIFSSEPLPVDFSDWYSSAESNSPVLQYVKGEIEISRLQVKLNTALALPKFTAGYMSEKVAGERFQGITVGMSVPLWENKNTVRQAKAQVRAAQTALEDTKVQFYNRLQNLFTRSYGLQENALRYRNALTACNSEALLKKALDAGEISLLNYLLEIEYYYDTMNTVLEAERDFSLSLAELRAVEL